MKRIPARSMWLRIFCICLLCSGSLAAKNPAPTEEQGPSLQDFLRIYGYFPFPFEADEEHPFLLRATLGEKKLKLLVDTGCIFTTIDPRGVPDAKTLGELKIKLQDSFLGEIAEPSVLLLDNLSFGPARFVHQPALGAKLDADYVALPFHGMLGLDFLYRNFCIIDCAGSHIYFRGSKPTAEQAKGIEESLRGSGYTPVSFTGGTRMIVEGDIRGKPTAWIVDTGARHTFLERSERDRLKLKPEQATYTGSALSTNIEGQVIGLQKIGLGTRRLWVTRVPQMSIGQRTWKDLYVGLVEMKMADLHDKEALGPNVHGFLGADLLLMKGALIDFSTQTIWFPPLQNRS